MFCTDGGPPPSLALPFPIPSSTSLRGTLSLFLHMYKGCQYVQCLYFHFKCSLWTMFLVVCPSPHWTEPGEKGMLLIAASPLPSSACNIVGFQRWFSKVNSFISEPIGKKKRKEPSLSYLTFSVCACTIMCHLTGFLSEKCSR